MINKHAGKTVTDQQPTDHEPATTEATMDRLAADLQTQMHTASEQLREHAANLLIPALQNDNQPDPPNTAAPT